MKPALAGWQWPSQKSFAWPEDAAPSAEAPAGQEDRGAASGLPAPFRQALVIESKNRFEPGPDVR